MPVKTASAVLKNEPAVLDLGKKPLGKKDENSAPQGESSASRRRELPEDSAGREGKVLQTYFACEGFPTKMRPL